MKIELVSFSFRKILPHRSLTAGIHDQLSCHHPIHNGVPQGELVQCATFLNSPHHQIYISLLTTRIVRKDILCWKEFNFSSSNEAFSKQLLTLGNFILQRV